MFKGTKQKGQFRQYHKVPKFEQQNSCETEEVVYLTADNSAHIVHQEETQTMNSTVSSTPFQNNEKIASDSSTQDDWLKGCL